MMSSPPATLDEPGSLVQLDPAAILEDEGEGYVALPDWLWQSGDFSHGAKVLYGVLKHYARRNGQAFPTKLTLGRDLAGQHGGGRTGKCCLDRSISERVAGATPVSKNTVGRYLDELITGGAVTKQLRWKAIDDGAERYFAEPGVGRAPTSSLYTLRWREPMTGYATGQGVPTDGGTPTDGDTPTGGDTPTDGPTRGTPIGGGTPTDGTGVPPPVGGGVSPQMGPKALLVKTQLTNHKNMSADADARPHNTDGKPDRTAAAATAKGFVDFWNVYPRRVSKRAAETAWGSALKRRVQAGEDLTAVIAEIVDAATRYRQLHHDERTETQFVPHPATWLNGDRFRDDLTQVAGGGARHRAPARPSNAIRETGVAARHADMFSRPPSGRSSR